MMRVTGRGAAVIAVALVLSGCGYNTIQSKDERSEEHTSELQSPI